MLKQGMFLGVRLTIATERIVDAEAAAERQRKLVVKDNRSMGRYYPGMTIIVV
jgi:hypothetical protein